MILLLLIAIISLIVAIKLSYSKVIAREVSASAQSKKENYEMEGLATER